MTTADLHWQERLFLADAGRWLGRGAGLGDRALGGASSKLRRVLDTVLDDDRVRRRVEAVTDEVISRIADISMPDAEPTSQLVPTSDSVARVAALRRVDRSAGRIQARCVGAMTMEGLAAGAASMTPVTAALSLLPDVAAALTISTTGSAQLLAAYGVTRDEPTALTAAIHVSCVATESDARTRRQLFLGLAQDLEGCTVGQPVPEEVSKLVAQQMAVRTMRETVEQTVRRVARRKLASAIPVLGVAVHAVAAGWLGGQVCEATRHLGRAVYLARSTGLTTQDLLGREPA